MSDTAGSRDVEIHRLKQRRLELYVLEEKDDIDVVAVHKEMKTVNSQLKAHGIDTNALSMIPPEMRAASSAYSTDRIEAEMALDRLNRPNIVFVSTAKDEDAVPSYVDEIIGSGDEESEDTSDDRPDYVRVYNANGKKICVRESGAVYLGATRTEWRIPPSLSARLHSHQIDALSTIRHNMETGRGTLIAHCMGGGKTLTALACTAITDRRAIVLCGVGVLETWASQLKTFLPELGMEAYLYRNLSVTSRDTSSLWHCHGGILLFGYDEFRNNANNFTFPSSPFLFIVDESHLVLSNKTLVYDTMTRLARDGILAPRQILLLSGTPMRNRLIGLYNLIHVIAPGLLGTPEQFKMKFSNVIEDDSTPKLEKRSKLQLLRQLLVSSRLVSYRAQEELSSQFPCKQDFVLWHTSCGSSMSGITQMHLAQVAMLPLKVKIARALIVQIQSQCPDDGIVVFSQYLAQLKQLQAIYPGPIIEGCVQASKRDMIVDDLTLHKILYVSMGAGSVGINLSRANRIILMNTSWSMADTDQAVSRCYRVGQTKTVFVYRLIAEDSVESRAYMQSITQKHAHALSIFAPVELSDAASSRCVKRKFKLNLSTLREKDPVLRRVRCKLTAVESHNGYMQTMPTTISSRVFNEANFTYMNQLRSLPPDDKHALQRVPATCHRFKYPCKSILVPPFAPVLRSVTVTAEEFAICLFAPGATDTSRETGYGYHVQGMHAATDDVQRVDVSSDGGEFADGVRCDTRGYEDHALRTVLCHSKGAIVTISIPENKRAHFNWFVIWAVRVQYKTATCIEINKCSEWSTPSAVMKGVTQEKLFAITEDHPLASSPSRI